MDMKNLIDLKNKRKIAVDAMEEARQAKVSAKAGGDAEALKKAAASFDEKKALVASLNEEIEDAESVIAEKGRFDGKDGHFVTLAEKKEKEKEDLMGRAALDKIRGDNEYMISFRTALQTHQRPDTAMAIEEFNPLTKALTITGGSTAGEDGGFLVPLDFDKKIIAETKDFLDISTLCNTEMVTTNSGWRAVEVAGQRTKLPKVDEMATIGKNNQPKFKKVTFTLSQYGDRLPVSNQLIQDVDYLMTYLAGWFGPKLILTKNDLVLTLLKALTFTAQTATTDAEKVKAIKSILNKSLNTAHSRAASLLTNQNVYDEMDGWVDGNGRPMLVPDVSGDFDRFKGRPVRYADNDEIGEISKTVSTTTTKYDPLFIGNFRNFATVFDRGVLEMASTNVGGDAWATNSTEIRVIARLDAQQIDGSAVVATGYKQKA